MTIRLNFLGAAGTVTGSKTVLSAGKTSWLVDCGLFQGAKAERQRNWEDLSFPIADIAALLLTHAHLDHSGYVPRLVKNGFSRPIHVSKGTADLCQVMWRDAAHLEEEFADYANESGYSHHKPALPLFTTPDAEKALGLLTPHNRSKWIQLNDRVSFCFFRSGHIVGSSFIQFRVGDGNGGNKIVTFSGDIGHERSLIMAPPEDIPASDVLILESTYGIKTHSRGDVVADWAEVARRTFSRGGVLVIPAFAVGRSQEVLRIIRLAEDRNLIPRVPVLLDSPMSEQATEIYLKHGDEHRDDCCLPEDSKLFLPHHFEVVKNANDSMLACMRDGPMVVISAAGMLSGGRILHHLKARLPKERNTVLFVGYQAHGSKGRFLQEQGEVEGKIRIHHQDVDVCAEIVTMDHLSAHGDHLDIITWLKRQPALPKLVLLNHGENGSQEGMKANLQKAFPGLPCEVIGTPQTLELFSHDGLVRRIDGVVA